MREIKFRGKRIDNGEWVFGWLSKTLLKAENYSEQYNITGTFWDYADCHNVVAATVGQFTGLKDKNGKEIYEGDIVKRTHRYFTTEKQPDATFTVEYINGGFYLTPNYISRNEYEIVVVGNIYDKEGMNKNE